MKCILIYDIPKDRIRIKIADACMDYGMQRIQFSAFCGNLARTHQEELIQKARKRLGKNAGKVYLYCIGEKEWAQHIEVLCEPKAMVETAAAIVGATTGGKGSNAT